MDKSFRKYLSFNQRQLEARLEKERDKLTQLERDEIMRVVGEERRRLRSENAKRKTHDALWINLMQPLHIELKTVNNSLRYKTRNYPVPERTAAMTAYRDHLIKLRKLLTKYHKAYDLTPGRLAKEKNVPNDGEHWTDWVPLHIKAQTYDLFNAIPTRFKAKVKVPFERKEKKSDWNQARLRLARKLDQELAQAYKDLANDPDEYDNHDHRQYIDRMELAQKALAIWEQDTPLPATWQAMFGNERYKGMVNEEG